MPNVSPETYRRLYEIYPAKACLGEDDGFDRRLRETIVAMGRHVGSGPGASPRYVAAQRRAAGAAMDWERV